MKIPRILFTALLAAGVIACAKNPVTGKNQFMLMSEKWELDTGKQMYEPLRQSQGGDYTVDPKVEKYVREVGSKLAQVSDRKLPYEFNVINDSSINAWALPGGKISINRGLLSELESEAELAAVLGHEIVHAAARHTASAQSRGVGSQLITIGAVVAMSDKIGGQAAQMLGAGASTLVNRSYGRKAESESDEYGMLYMKRAGYDVQGAVELQQKFIRFSQKAGPTSKWQQLLSSHPTSAARVSKNRETAAKLGVGGRVAADRYRAVMSRIKKTKPAYDNYDNARSAFNKGNRRQAKSLLQKAIKIEPREALFHSALGDIAAADKNYRSAKRYYDKAIKLNSAFYFHHLKRGEANYQLGNLESARRDVERSLSMLPSGAAFNLLGNVAKRSNDTSGAKKNYKEAVKYGGNDAKAAYSELLVMDLGANPNDYLQTRAGMTKNGTLGIQINNPTPRAIGGIEYSITAASSGKARKGRYRGTIAAGKGTVVDTGLSISKAALGDVKVRIVRAQLTK